MVGADWRAPRPRRPSPSWATRSSASASRTPPAARTASPPRAASMPPKITRTTATAFTVCSTTPSRAAISARANPTSTAVAGERGHHRPVRGARRALRSRIRRAACKPVVRRGPGFAHVLRPRTDRPATAPGRLPGPLPPDRPRRRPDVSPHRDARPRCGGRPCPGHCHAQPGHRRNSVPRGRCGRARHRRVRQRVFSLDQRQGLQCHGHLARLQEGRPVRQPVLHPDPPDLHPRQRRTPVQADADVRVPAQRRPCLGAETQRGLRQTAGLHSGRGPGLLSGAKVSKLRQPGAARHLLARREAGLRRGPRRRPRRPRRVP